MTGVLIRDCSPWEARGRGWGDAASAQDPRSPEELGEAGGTLPQSPWGERGPGTP